MNVNVFEEARMFVLGVRSNWPVDHAPLDAVPATENDAWAPSARIRVSEVAAFPTFSPIAFVRPVMVMAVPLFICADGVNATLMVFNAPAKGVLWLIVAAEKLF